MKTWVPFGRWLSWLLPEQMALLLPVVGSKVVSGTAVHAVMRVLRPVAEVAN